KSSSAAVHPRHRPPRPSSSTLLSSTSALIHNVAFLSFQAHLRRRSLPALSSSRVGLLPLRSSRTPRSSPRAAPSRRATPLRSSVMSPSSSTPLLTRAAFLLQAAPLAPETLI
ncbi:hypothetical protein S245_042208, partial [Arachis hypogaea]